MNVLSRNPAGQRFPNFPLSTQVSYLKILRGKTVASSSPRFSLFLCTENDPEKTIKQRSLTSSGMHLFRISDLIEISGKAILFSGDVGVTSVSHQTKFLSLSLSFM